MRSAASLRVVGLLVAHVDVGAGDAPVAMTAGPALFVEVEVGADRRGSRMSPDQTWRPVRGSRGKTVVAMRFVEAGVGAVDVVGLVEGALRVSAEGFGVDAVGDEAAA